MECAKALRDLGLETHVVEFAPRLMAVQVDDEGGRILRNKIESLGVRVHTQRNTVEIRDGATGRHRITRKVAPALAAGCPVVVKPAESTPLTSSMTNSAFG